MKLQRVIALVFVFAFVAIMATACFPPKANEPSVGDTPNITADMASPGTPHPVDGAFAECATCHADAKAAHDQWGDIWDEDTCVSCHEPITAAPPAQPEPPAAEPSDVAEGELVGEGAGFGGPIKVKVVMDGDKISAVEVLSHSETPGISDPAINTVPGAIVDAQSADVDVVAGATMSSKGIIEAVKKALEGQGEASAPSAAAGGDEYTGEGAGFGGPIKVKVVMDGDKISAVEVVSHSETPGISDPAINTVPGAIVDAQSADVDVVSGATMSSKGIMEAVKNALANVSSAPAEPAAAEPAPAEPAAEAGGSSVLEGEGSGFGGSLKVKVTMDGDKITAVEVVSHGETPGISDPALNAVPGAIVNAQSADVDVVSGATMTSKGIMEAVKNALSKK